MKTDDEWIRDLKRREQKSRQASLDQGEQEIARCYDRIKSEGVEPDRKLFSVARLRFIPLWIIWGYADPDNVEIYYLSSTGKLYVKTSWLAYPLPATRSLMIRVGELLRAEREKQTAN